MDTTITLYSRKRRSFRLSGEKNKANTSIAPSTSFQNSINAELDESLQYVQSTSQLHNPFVVSDSDSNSFNTSKCGNVSVNITIISSPGTQPSKPSVGGWSSDQNIISAIPKNKPTPSTPTDTSFDLLEHCSMKTIENSQRKVLNSLYGDTWKSIPSLFNATPQRHGGCHDVSEKLFDNNDKENYGSESKKNIDLSTRSKIKQHSRRVSVYDIKPKKKLFTENVPSTPGPNLRRAVSTIKKKKKSLTVTELVGLSSKVESFTSRINNLDFTPPAVVMNRLSFIGSLADNVPSGLCHPEALQYLDNYKTLREQLVRKLYVEFNRLVFDNKLEADMPILFNTKMRITAGTTTNRLLRLANGEKARYSNIKLSTKVLDTPQRLRDTLIHELCHTATWIIDGDLNARHGPPWKYWAAHAIRVLPELGKISRCHNMKIYTKYTYRCTACGYCLNRHSKSIDTSKRFCRCCFGRLELIINVKNKDGKVVSKLARKGPLGEFPAYVKENYAKIKDVNKTHADVMKILAEHYQLAKASSQN